MFHLIYKYLILNGEAGLPGIGMFILHKLPATAAPENNVIHAPLPVIKLNQQPVFADNNFYRFVAAEMHTDESIAAKDIHDFSSKLKEEVQLKKWVELPGMGILTQGVRDEIKFKSTPALQEYYPPVAIEKITATEGSESIAPLTYSPAAKPPLHYFDETPQRDRWWIAALILTLIGACAIVYYYFYLQPGLVL